MGEVPLRDAQPQGVLGGLGRSHRPIGREQRQVKPAEPLGHGPYEAVKVSGAGLGVLTADHGLSVMCPHGRFSVNDELRQLTHKLAVALR